MDATTTMIVFSLAMLIGSYISGMVPLTCKMSESRIKLMTAVGAGLLVGTALCVIIPEGVNTLYMPEPPIPDLLPLPVENDADLQNPSFQKSISDRLKKLWINEGEVANKDTGDAHGGGGNHAGHHHRAIKQLPAEIALEEESAPSIRKVNSDEHSHDSSCPQPSHSGIGMSLILGFILMFLIDRIGDGQSGNTTTIGLVVHAAADGIALGAAVASHRAAVEMLVFIAIMLHKAPSSFGLTTFLLHEGFDNNRIRKHLAMFACSAPLGAIITYSFLVSGGASLLNMDSNSSTGYALLFSAGTFLYVATVHVLPEILGPNHSNGHGHSHGLPSSSSSSNAPSTTSGNKSQPDKAQILALLFGMISPLFMSMGHSH